LQPSGRHTQMITILAHRGNTSGACSVTENRLPAVHRALARGWGLEIDIRRTPDGRFYVSHDPQASADGLGAGAFCALFREYPAATIALNVKETGYEDDLLAYLEDQDVLSQTFLFDMELIERHPGATARLFRHLHATVPIAARVSDRGESVDQALAIEVAAVIWLDEFDSQWCTEADVQRLKRAGRTVYAVSPDLHKYSLEISRQRWTQFYDWGVDGICTDFPAELERMCTATCEGR
jgi:glycerophosphoryl diester phosphodiesterase